MRDLLAGEAPLSRETLESALAPPFPSVAATAAEARGDAEDAGAADAKGRRTARPSRAPRAAPALGVTVDGRAGRLELRPGSTPLRASVVFTDGEREEVPLERVRLTQWMT